MSPEVIIQPWHELQNEACAIRRHVFIEEQGVPESMEWDEFDEQSIHALAKEDGKAIGYARLLPTRQLGRMAVLPEYRRRGVGSHLVRTIEAEAIRHDYKDLFLHAQVSAIPFYTQLGYTVNGDIFMEAGIVHQIMTRRLNV